MFEQQTVTIKSGTGDNSFEATVKFEMMSNPEQTKIVMENLRQMQKERMEWSSTKVSKPPAR